MELNRAVAIAEIGDVDAALAVIDGLNLDSYHYLHAARAELLRRVDRVEEARAAYEQGARARARGRRARPPGTPGGETRSMSDADLTLAPIGRVESPLVDPAMAPTQGFEGGPGRVALGLDPGVVEGLDGLEPGARVIVLTWLDRADRTVLRVHPRDDRSNPLRGVFTTRSADRPIRSACTRSMCWRSRATGSG